MKDFEAMFTRYFGQVYRFALRLTGSEDAAEELTQQTFFKALKGIDGFEGRSDPVTWLCSIAKHEFLSGKRRDREDLYAPDAPVFDSSEPGIDTGFVRREEALRLHRHLHAMDEPYREVFMLRVFGELMFDQIAALFGKSASWARVTYYRAKLRLQEEMEAEDGKQE